MPASGVEFDVDRYGDPVAAAVAGRHQEIDELRRLPDDVARALVGTGVMRSWVPAEIGGADLGAPEGLAVIEEISRIDGACGWCTMIGVASSLLVGTLSPDAARTIFGDPAAVVGGHTTPVGEAVLADGGVTVSADWSWGSGIAHSTWMGGGAMLRGDGDADVPIFVVLPRADIEVLDTWRVSGMSGTGSTDYRCRDAFVPDGYYVRLGVTEPWLDHPLYRMPTITMLALGVGAVGSGLGLRALEEFRDIAAGRTLLGAPTALVDSAVAQSAYARAEADIEAARALLHTETAHVWDQVVTGRPADREQRRRLRLAATNAAQASARAVRELHLAAGSAAFDQRLAFQRVFRDVHVVSQHIRVASRTWEMVGAGALGVSFDGQL